MNEPMLARENSKYMKNNKLMTDIPHKIDTDASNSIDQQTVERLRASKDAFESRIKTSGKQAGIDYVGQKASYEEMHRLDRWYDSVENIGTATEGWTFLDVASVMAGNDGSERDIDNALRCQYGDDIDDENWIDAFIDGAVTKFNELKPKI